MKSLPEDVLHLDDPASGLRGVLVIDDTRLGPALGGVRMRAYPNLAAAETDARRLARAMSLKNALAGLRAGGGKCALITPEDTSPASRRRLFRALGARVDALDGRFYTARDFGTTRADSDAMREVTRFVADERALGDLDEATARGVLAGIRACAERLETELSALRVLVQGLGSVGLPLARMLRESGARVLAAEPDAQRADRGRTLGVELYAPGALLAQPADIWAPCALGQVIDEDTAARVQVRAICGAANNQLANENAAGQLRARGVLYAPDFAVNAGAVIAGALYYIEDTVDAGPRIDGIQSTVREIFDEAAASGRPPHQVAEAMAAARLDAAC